MKRHIWRVGGALVVLAVIVKVFLFLLLLVSLLFLAGCRGTEELPETEVPPPQVEEVISKEISATEGGTIVVAKEMNPYSAGFALDILPVACSRSDKGMRAMG